MGRKRRTFTDKFKAKVALEAVKGIKTLAELATQCQHHGRWRRLASMMIPCCTGQPSQWAFSKKDHLVFMFLLIQY